MLDRSQLFSISATFRFEYYCSHKYLKQLFLFSEADIWHAMLENTFTHVTCMQMIQ